MEKNKLLLIIGRPGSGKSKYLQNYATEKNIPILDFDRILGKKIPEGKDASYVHGFVKGLLETYTPEEILLDKKHILYQKDSNIDMLQFLKDLAEQKPVVATWNGYTSNGKLFHVRDLLGDVAEYDLDSIGCSYIEL